MVSLILFLIILILIRNVIEDAIRSEENQFECHMPDLPLNSPEMMAFLKNERPIQCDDVEPWVVCGHSKEVRVQSRIAII